MYNLVLSFGFSALVSASPIEIPRVVEKYNNLRCREPSRPEPLGLSVAHWLSFFTRGLARLDSAPVTLASTTEARTLGGGVPELVYPTTRRTFCQTSLTNVQACATPNKNKDTGIPLGSNPCYMVVGETFVIWRVVSGLGNLSCEDSCSNGRE